MISISTNIALVINPLHSKALSVAAEIAALLKTKNIEHTLFIEQWPQTWIDFTEAWIIGGNGTLNYFINHYPQLDLPLAIFKGGTNNDFHWLLYGDVSVAQQAELVLAASPKPVDAGLCNNRLFIHAVTIGFGASLQNEFNAEIKSKSSALFSALKNSFHFKTFLCSVNTESFHWGKKCLGIRVANGNRYGSNFHRIPTGVLNDGLLDSNIVGNIHPFARPLYTSVLAKGAHHNLPLITYVKSAIVIIKALKEIPAHADGEYFSATEFAIECLPARFFFLY